MQLTGWLNKDLMVGNRILDSAHLELFDIIDRMPHLIEVEDTDALLQAFELLEEKLCACFIVEKNTAQAVSFDFTQLQLSQRHLLEQFSRIRDKLMAKNGAWSKFEGKDCTESMRNYLVLHIKEDSKPLKIVLDTYLYDFNPSIQAV